MRRKGQVDSHVLVYILVVLVVASVAFVGYKFISKNSKAVDKSDLIQFREKLAADVGGISANSSQFKKFSYNLPTNVEEVCFADLGKKDQIMSSKIIGFYPSIKESVSGGQDSNVFFIGKSDSEAFSIPNIVLDHYPFLSCFHQDKGKIEVGILGFEGGKSLIVGDFKAVAQLNPASHTILKSPDKIVTLDVAPGTTMDVPPGTPNSNIISIEMQSTGGISGVSKSVSDTYKFEPSGAKFSAPIRLTMRYDPKEVSDCPKKLTFNQYNNDGTLEASNPSKSIDCAGKTADFEINGFSDGAVTEDSGNVGTINLRAFLDGNELSSINGVSIGYSCTACGLGQTPQSQASIPLSLGPIHNVPAGTDYSVTYNSGAPDQSVLKFLEGSFRENGAAGPGPTVTKHLDAGGIIEYNFGFYSTGKVVIAATYPNPSTQWQGKITGEYTDPWGHTKDTSANTGDYLLVPIGNHFVRYKSDGPPGAILHDINGNNGGVNAGAFAALYKGATVTFTFNFVPGSGGCKSNSDCHSGTCDTATGTCVTSGGCNPACMSSFQACGTNGRCVPDCTTYCPSPSTCASNGACVQAAGVNTVGASCTSNANCASGETCNVASGKCQLAATGCTSNSQCPTGQTCNTATGQCQSSGGGDACSSSKPTGICPTGQTCSSGSCVACQPCATAQNGMVTGIVIDPDGRIHNGYDYLLQVGHTDGSNIDGCHPFDFVGKTPKSFSAGEFYIDRFLGHGAGDGCGSSCAHISSGDAPEGSGPCLGYLSMKVVSKDASGNVIPEYTKTVSWSDGGFWAVKGKVVAGGTMDYTVTLRDC